MKKAFLFTPALLALSINAISNANAYSYDKVYVFGDSLSDGGNNGRYTTDGKISKLYNEYIAQQITNTKLIPSNNGGTNYAQGGATALKMLRQDPKLNAFNPNTKEQVERYLNKHNQQADSNGIYIHWVGGNDLAEALAAGQKDPSKAYITVNTSATEASNQINKLVEKGAGLIIAPTVPDVGITPKLLESLIETGLKDKGIPEDGINSILQEVHSKINKHEIPNGAARELALKNVFYTLAQKGAKLIPKASADQIEKELTEGYDKISKDASKLTDAYNSLVDEKISEKNGNILRADINGLLNEVIANPLIYGIQNTLGYACAQGESAAECDSDPKKGFTGDKQFLFSDNFHPTPLGHKIMAQYITSIYNAPSQVMTLNQVNRAPVKSALSSLDGHLQQLRNGGNAQGKIGVFGGYTGSQNKTFTLGGDYQLIDNLLLGAMYSDYKDERTPAANFSYEGRGHVLTAYTLWNYYNNGWLSGDVHYSRTNYDSLTRAIQLGNATRRETGSSTGKQWGARITAGWDIPVTNYLTTSPIAQYAWSKGEIDGYRESGNNSTSMHFSDQSYTSKVGTLGWRVDTKFGRFNPYASVQFNHQFGDTSYKLSSAINSTKTSFVQESGKQSTNWRQYTVGVNANLFNNLRGFASVTRNEGSAQDPNYNFSFGINASF
ncbi:autotransporter outer membrane beta-barrel domain-containing protein [Xenorhabdus anantnagensis]|uniref:SGNH/GDSL hydrolase family protein n=1 Tax=Xenorhabdus anantnagensis TaxID=3025875 RepID=A0ABT5LQN7_9GAMM|nr:autotransporter domain-containing protein [Xenorhabdus anantnagensis]MDC9596118.1 SGNH/GDSL hydrolase family protein [Xenorhabdus anantnagensis]